MDSTDRRDEKETKQVGRLQKGLHFQRTCRLLQHASGSLSTVLCKCDFEGKGSKLGMLSFYT